MDEPSSYKVPTTDIVCGVASGTVLVSYHAYLAYCVRYEKRQTVVYTSRRVRRRWLSGMLQSKQDIIIIQALRNQVMASTFLASTAVAIAFGVLAFLNSLNSSVSAVSSSLLGFDDRLLLTRIVLLFISYAYCFFCFTQSVRYYNHLAFCTNTVAIGDVGEPFVIGLLDKGGLFYTMGMRGYYLSFIVIAWFWSPFAMLASSLILASILIQLDYVF